MSVKRKTKEVYAAVYFVVVVSLCRWTKANNFSCETDEVQFKCRSDGKCIPKDWECDHAKDCEDSSDEENCGNCDEIREFSCPDKCIYKYWLCDGYHDCADGSDESPNVCANMSCYGDEFMCVKSKKCIWKTWVCDHDNDCDDGSDEVNCPVSECVNGFQCANGKCIDSNWRCNHDYDCDDKSDEESCTYKPCDLRWEFQCNDKRCILKEAFCDNHYDCEDRSDEPEGCTSTTQHKNKCPDTHFDCKDGTCIKKEWKCDGRPDCVSGDDERTCTSTCPEGQIRCQSGECISKSLKCDGKANCEDQSDEKNCGPSLLKCKKGEFKCGTSERCISESLLCDNQSDCANGEDESQLCGVDECSKENGGCEYKCHDLKIGRRCSCPEGFELKDDKKSCQDINECNEFGKCSQICENIKSGGYKCRCVAGYRLESKDHRTCKAIERNPYLVFSDHFSIRKLYLHKSRFFGIVRNLVGIIAVDYHLGKNWMFWSDQKNNSIQRTSLGISGDFVKETIITNVHSPDGIAVDWVTSKLYWTDAWQKRIEVSDVHGRHRCSLITTDIDMPRAIAVHPYKGVMFWTDWGDKPKIEKCGMDGDPTTRKAIITTKIMWPNALTIDYTINSIWWIDAKLDFIEHCDLDGGNRRVILGQDSVHHPFSISIFEDHIYWSDLYKTAIYKANKFTGKNVTFLKQGLVNTLGISMIHPQRQPASFNFCQENNGECSHLCLLSAEQHKKLRRLSCACPEGMNLLPDNKTCNTSDALLCKKGMCFNGTCIPGNKSGGPRCQCDKGYTGAYCRTKILSKSTKDNSDANAVTIGISVGVVAIIFIVFGIASGAFYMKLQKRSYTTPDFMNPVYPPTTDPIEANGRRGPIFKLGFMRPHQKKEPFASDPDPDDV